MLRSVERGVLGSPTFYVGDEIFFGKDRLETLKRSPCIRDSWAAVPLLQKTRRRKAIRFSFCGSIRACAAFNLVFFASCKLLSGLEGRMRASRKAGRGQIMTGDLLGANGATIMVRGLRGRPFRDVYHYLAEAPWAMVLLWIAATFAAANGLFALGYMALGGVANARPGSFGDAFFFSVQTRRPSDTAR